MTLTPLSSVPPSQASNGKDFNGTDKESGTVTKTESVPLKPSNGKAWDGGTDKKGGMDDEEIIEVLI